MEGESARDILALLARNDVDILMLEQQCASLGLGRELRRVLAFREGQLSGRRWAA